MMGLKILGIYSNHSTPPTSTLQKATQQQISDEKNVIYNYKRPFVKRSRAVTNK